MELVTSSFFWVTLAQIMMINIVLSGDNAVVIALASRSLPPRQQKQAILFGSMGAIVLRVVLTFFAVMLLGLPFLKIVGSVLLGWIGIQMLIPEDDEARIDDSTQLWAAIKTIVVADFIMSLDNVLGVAAAAKGSVPLLVIGLAVSIPLIIYGSTIILKLMTRFPVIITVGGGVLGWVAGEMAVTDPAVAPWIDTNAHWLHASAPGLAALFVVIAGKTAANQKVSAAWKAFLGRPAEPRPEPPVGYRWLTLPWRRGADGKRDYAAYDGKTEYRRLLPWSRVHPPRRRAGKPQNQ
ncbi:MAG TPA: TerC family protein [Reyranella sp.]|nr:TerC family protein [Reyranella sp.]